VAAGESAGLICLSLRVGYNTRVQPGANMARDLKADKYAGKFNKLGSMKHDVWYIKDGVVINENINSGFNCLSTSVPTVSIFKSMVDCGELVPA
jgi:hypothetical protein